MSFFDDIPTAECAECGYKMAHVRSDMSEIAALARVECVACDATGTVEYRPEKSIADQTGVSYHGDATEGDRDE